MFSPNRSRVESRTITPSPLRMVSSPFYNAVKSAQTKATKDFDRFYENLQYTLSPSNSESRNVKRISETNNSSSSKLNQQELNSPVSRTSLTPFLERHTINDDARATHSKTSPEPDIEDTPSLLDNIDSSFTNSSFSNQESFNQPEKSSRNSCAEANLYSPKFSRASTSLKDNNASDENKRLDKLLCNLSKLRRLSSFLAGDEPLPDNLFIDDYEEEVPIVLTRNHKSTSELKTPIVPTKSYKSTSALKTPISTTKTNEPLVNHQLATPPQSVDYKAAKVIRQSITPTPRKSPLRHSTIDLNPKKLKSAEIITSPGGSRIRNRFWEEIHGVIERESSPEPLSPEKKSQSWTTDDTFWSSDTPAPTSLNHRLMEAAYAPDSPYNLKKRDIFDLQDEDEDMLYKARSFKTPKTDHQGSTTKHPVLIEEDMLYKSKSFKTPKTDHQGSTTKHPVLTDEDKESLYQHRLFKAQQASHCKPQNLFTELESANSRDEVQKRNTTHVFPNVLAELKAKHGHRLIDDSDSYKFA